MLNLQRNIGKELYDMKKAKKLRRRTGMIAAMSIVVLSFFPIICTADGGITIMGIVTHEKFEFNMLSTILFIAYLFTPVMSLVNYYAYFRKKEGIGKMVLSVYISIFGLLSVIGIGGYAVTLEFFEVAMPGLTIWVFLRFLFGFMEGIIRMSGEELFERLLKEKS